MVGFRTPDFPKLTLNSAMAVRQNCPALRAIVPGPKDQLIYALRQINPITVGVSLGLGVLVSRFCNRITQNNHQTMRSTSSTIVLTPAEQTLFHDYQVQERSKLLRDTIKSHPICEQSLTVRQARKPNLNDASTAEFLQESLSRLGQGLWFLCEKCTFTTGVVLHGIWQKAASSWDEPSQTSANQTYTTNNSPSILAAACTPLAASEMHQLPQAHNITNSNIRLGQNLPAVQIDSKGFINTDGVNHTYEAWTSSEIPLGYPKILAVLPAKPHRKEELQSLGDAIDDRGFPMEKFKSYTIVNVADNPMQSGVLGGLGLVATGFRNIVKPGTQGHIVENIANAEILTGALQRPDMAIIADTQSATKTAWGLDLDTCYTLVLDEHNNVVTALKGKPSATEEKAILDWCQAKIKTLNTANDQPKNDQPKNNHRNWWQF